MLLYWFDLKYQSGVGIYFSWGLILGFGAVFTLEQGLENLFYTIHVNEYFSVV